MFKLTKLEHIELNLIAIAIFLSRETVGELRFLAMRCHSSTISTGMSCTFDMRFQAF